MLATKKITVVHNGIDLNGIFYPHQCDELRQTYAPANEFIFLSVAPDLMSEIKGGNWVIDLAKRLHGMPVRFIMIGVHDTGINCPSNVTLIPRIKDSKLMASHYSIADAFLITSKKETFSLTTVEALACGTPVIGFDSGGPPELAPWPFGSFVPFGDMARLLDLTIKIVNGELVLPSTQNCSTYARNNFSDKLMFQNYMEIYMEMHSRDIT